MTRLRSVATDGLRPEELAAVRSMVFEAFGGRFDEDDWDHDDMVIYLEECVKTVAGFAVGSDNGFPWAHFQGRVVGMTARP